MFAKAGKFLGGIFAAAMLTNAAQATYPYYDVDADIGTYSPVVLGDTVNLSACNSIVVNANNASDYHNLCSFSTSSLNYDFSLTWEVSFNGVTSTIGTYDHWGGGSHAGTTQEGLEISVATGDGTLFSTVGNYTISLWVDMDDNDWIYLPNNSWGLTGNDGVWMPGASGTLNVDLSQTSLAITAAVPEPEAALLLIPALLLLRNRQRRRTLAPL